MPHKQDARSQLPPEDRASSARHSLHTMPPARSRPARLEYQNVTIKSAAAGSFHQPHEALSMALQQLVFASMRTRCRFADQVDV